MYQLQMMYPGFDYRRQPVAVRDVIDVETPEDQIEAERLVQRGAVCGYYAPGEPETPGVPEHPSEPGGNPDETPEPHRSSSITQPMTTQDLPAGNVGRRSRG